MNTEMYSADDILRRADFVALTEADGPGRLYVEHIRARFARAVAMLDAHPMPAEIRQAVEIVISQAFEIGTIGDGDAARWQREMRVLNASVGRTNITTRQIERLQTFCAANGWQLDDLNRRKKKWLAEALGVTVHRVNTYLQKLRVQDTYLQMLRDRDVS